MGRYALSRRRTAFAITSVTLALTGGTLLPVLTAGSAAAAPVADGKASVVDVVTASDGSAVAVWNQFASGNGRQLYAAVRPAAGDTWNTPALLATTPTEAGSVRLHASADGTVTALWVEFPDETAPGSSELGIRLVSSVLAADRSGWSAPAELVGTDAAWADGGIDLAEGPDGTLTAVWATKSDSASKAEVHAATRGTDGTWSRPAQLSAAATDGADGAYAPSVAVTSDGTAVVVYRETAGESASVRTVSRAPGATAWTTPTAASGSYRSISDPEAAAADDGSVTVAYGGTSAGLLTTTRSAAGAWSVPQSVPDAGGGSETPEPLIAPDGDITLVWVDYNTISFGTRTTTREADTGTWSAVRTLSTVYVPEQYDATVTADGKADLVSRDTSGNLYRNSGDGKGSFGARVKIATGWGGYKSLS
ncbi:VCBS repeat-containing protein [Streptomyces prunicolor]|uniref:FG-GAP repeat domain-containing protein n=1 Tax=Streptomyces prunicolor TaxID=67348 RepID=UPI0038658349|nr:VCBS repeat-containing protein [Streptomyces prunicolor]